MAKTVAAARLKRQEALAKADAEKQAQYEERLRRQAKKRQPKAFRRLCG